MFVLVSPSFLMGQLPSFSYVYCNVRDEVYFFSLTPYAFYPFFRVVP